MVKQSVMERRQWIRARRVLSIEYRPVGRIRKGLDPDWQLSTTEDMSLGGVSFYTDQEYHEGDALEIRVVMSGVLNIFKGRSRVIRVEKKRNGSYFFVALALTGFKKKRSPSRPSDVKSSLKKRKRI